jgi:energy-converting hydrogenase Eha subunit F
MKLRFDGILSGDGGFADIWRAYDATDRLVAVKIIRDSSIDISDALTHAKALVRAAHKNIVTVFAVTDVEDPGRPGTHVPAIVMEYLSGETLHDAMSRKSFSDTEVLKISVGLIRAVRHIHQADLVHGDLHEKNVMIVSGEAKLIDILYRYSLLAVDAGKREALMQREIDAVRLLTGKLATKSSIDPGQIAAFIRDAQTADTLDALEAAVWALLGAPATAMAPSPNTLTPAPAPRLQMHPADSKAGLELAGQPLARETKEDLGSLSPKMVPRATHLTIINRGLVESDTQYLATLTLTTDEPAALAKSVDEIKSQLNHSVLLDKALTPPDAPLAALLQNVGMQPRLLEWLATTSFSAHLYFSARAALQDADVWPASRLNTEFVVLPIVHRLSDKSIQVQKMTSNIMDVESHLDMAVSEIKAKFHRTISRPSLGDQNRNPYKSIFELADLVLICSETYLANPRDDVARSVFAHVRTRLKYAANVATSDRHTRDKNPLP